MLYTFVPFLLPKRFPFDLPLGTIAARCGFRASTVRAFWVLLLPLVFLAQRHFVTLELMEFRRRPYACSRGFALDSDLACIRALLDGDSWCMWSSWAALADAATCVLAVSSVVCLCALVPRQPWYLAESVGKCSLPLYLIHLAMAPLTEPANAAVLMRLRSSYSASPIQLALALLLLCIVWAVITSLVCLGVLSLFPWAIKMIIKVGELMASAPNNLRRVESVGEGGEMDRLQGKRPSGPQQRYAPDRTILIAGLLLLAVAAAPPNSLLASGNFICSVPACAKLPNAMFFVLPSNATRWTAARPGVGSLPRGVRLEGAAIQNPERVATETECGRRCRTLQHCAAYQMTAEMSTSAEGKTTIGPAGKCKLLAAGYWVFNQTVYVTKRHRMEVPRFVNAKQASAFFDESGRRLWAGFEQTVPPLTCDPYGASSPFGDKVTNPATSAHGERTAQPSGKASLSRGGRHRQPHTGAHQLAAMRKVGGGRIEAQHTGSWIGLRGGRGGRGKKVGGGPWRGGDPRPIAAALVPRRPRLLPGDKGYTYHSFFHREDPALLVKVPTPIGLGTPDCAPGSCPKCAWISTCRNLTEQEVAGWQRTIAQNAATKLRLTNKCAVVARSDPALDQLVGPRDRVSGFDHVLRVEPTCVTPGHSEGRTSYRVWEGADAHAFREQRRVDATREANATIVRYCPPTLWVSKCWKGLASSHARGAELFLSPLAVFDLSRLLGRKPSSAAIAVMIALEICNSVTLFGFGTGRVQDDPSQASLWRWLSHLEQMRSVQWQRDEHTVASGCRSSG
mmetsp:Transcript_21330/g.47963  ORF Transcript_21330/g.47963 Transcript_21330/m.47963 type:complete len:792 (-) Transcript_21330:295-2670(-)